MLYFSGTVTSGYISSVWVYPWNDKSKYQAKMTLYGQINMFFILKNMFAGMKNLITKYQGFFSPGRLARWRAYWTNAYSASPTKTWSR